MLIKELKEVGLEEAEEQVVRSQKPTNDDYGSTFPSVNPT